MAESAAMTAVSRFCLRYAVENLFLPSEIISIFLYMVWDSRPYRRKWITRQDILVVCLYYSCVSVDSSLSVSEYWVVSIESTGNTENLDIPMHPNPASRPRIRVKKPCQSVSNVCWYTQPVGGGSFRTVRRWMVSKTCPRIGWSERRRRKGSIVDGWLNRAFRPCSSWTYRRCVNRQKAMDAVIFFQFGIIPIYGFKAVKTRPLIQYDIASDCISVCIGSDAELFIPSSE